MHYLLFVVVRQRGFAKVTSVYLQVKVVGNSPTVWVHQRQCLFADNSCWQWPDGVGSPVTSVYLQVTVVDIGPTVWVHQ